MIHAAILDAPFDFAELRPLEARAGDTVRSLSADLPRHLPFVAALNGEVLLRAEWERVLEDGDRLIFIIGPGGSGVKDVLRFTLTIGLMLTAGHFLGAGGLGLTGWKFGAAMLAANAASGMLINALLPMEVPQSPSLASPEAASPTYSLQGQGNQARLGNPRPRLYGRHILTPDFDAAWYTEYRGNDLYLCQIFNLGIGYYDQHEWMVEDTPFWTEADGLTDSFSDIEVQYCEPGEEVTLVANNVITSIEVSGQTLLGPNEEGHETIGPFAANPAETECNALAFDVVFPGGLGRVTDTGKIGSVSVTVCYEAQMIDTSGNPLGDWIELDTITYNYASRTAQRISEKFPVARGRWRAQATRTSETPDEDRTFDTVQWEGLRAYLVGDARGSMDCTRLAMIWRASDQISQMASRRVRVVQTSRLPEYLGQDEETGEHLWGSLVPTRDLLPICRDIITNTSYRSGMPPIGMAVDMFAALHATWVARGDTFDGVIDRAMSIGEALTMVLRVGRAQPVWVGADIGVIRDEPKALAKQFFTPRNIVRGTFEYQPLLPTPITPNAIIVEYWDERFWTKREVFCSVRGINPAEARAKRVTVVGIVDRLRAWKFGIFLDASETWRRELASFDVEYEGELLLRGDPIDLAHPLPSWGMSIAVRDFDLDELTLTLAADAKWSGANTNFVWLRRPDGMSFGPVIANKGESDRHVAFDADDFASVVSQQGDPAEWLEEEDGTKEPVTAVVGSGDDIVARALLIATDVAGEARVRLETVIDDPRVYTAETDFEVPAEVIFQQPVKPTAAPSLGPIAVVVSGTRYSPIISGSVAPALSATMYVWALSYDDITYEPIGQGETMYAWSGAVLPGTVWLRCIAIGPGGRDMQKAFRDLTISEAAPGVVTGVSPRAFFDSAQIRFTLPKIGGQVEEGIRGTLVSYSDTSGFDPEDPLEYVGQVRNEPPVNIVTIPLDFDTVYFRIAAFNVFGESALNWTSEVAVSRVAISSAQLSSAVQEALATAEDMASEHVVRIDSNGRVAGFALVGGETVDAGWLVDHFFIAHPDINGGDPFPAFLVEDGQVIINELVAGNITAEKIYAALIEVGTLFALTLASPLEEGETLDDARLVIDTSAPYIRMRRPVP